MIFQQVQNSYDVTLLCMGIAGGILWISYFIFVYWITHTGDFYKIRRWKAAIGLAGITTAILLLLFLFILFINIDLSGRSSFDIAKTVIRLLFAGLILAIPFIIVVTIGAHHQIKWWFLSDDYLDKIWPDPNKGHKSPIRDL